MYVPHSQLLSNLVPWLVAAPVLAALLASLLGLPLRRNRGVPRVIAHLLVLLLAAAAARSAPGTFVLGYGSGPSQGSFLLILDRPVALGIVVLAVLFLLISLFSSGYVGSSRSGGTFFSLLLVEQAAASFVLLAGDLFTLYVALFVLSLSVMFLVGIDFAQEGGRAALRVFATPEVPAAVALVSYWLIAARGGTAAFADLPRQATWLADPSTTLLVAPIILALAVRSGLFPFQRWVIAGCRASATPAAVALGAVVLPVGAYVVARLVGDVLPLDPTWPRILAFLGALSVVVAGIGGLRERSALGWLGYAAIAQVGLAVVGFSRGALLGQAGAWYAVVGGAFAVALLGLSLGLLTRATRLDQIAGPAALPREWTSRLALGIGLLAVGGFPPLPTFTARVLVLSGLLGSGDRLDEGVGALVVLGTFLFAAAAWQALRRPGQPSPNGNGNGHRAEARLGQPELVVARAARAPAWSVPPGPPPPLGRAALRAVLSSPHWVVEHTASPDLEWEVQLSLTALLALVVLPGLIAPVTLARLPELGLARPSPQLWLIASVILILTFALSLGLKSAARAVATRLRLRKSVTRRFVWAGETLHVSDVTDPYLVVGAILVFLGRACAELLDNTLGRLARVR